MTLEEYLVIDSNNKHDLHSMYQTRIKNYLVAKADDKLAEKIIVSKKNLSDCFDFVLEEIKAEYIKANGQVSGGYACEDEYVYGLAFHYFDEKSIVPKHKIEEKPKEAKEVKVESKPKQAKSKKITKEEIEARSYGGMTLFG